MFENHLDHPKGTMVLRPLHDHMIADWTQIGVTIDCKTFITNFAADWVQEEVPPHV